MRAIPFALLSGFLLLGTARAEELPRATPQEVGLSAEKLDQVRSVVQTALDKHQAAGVVVLVARRGKVAYLESFGKLDLATDKAMPTDAIFRIYSMTKPITSVAALMLVEEGKLKLDEPVATYLPDLKGLRVSVGEGTESVEARREMTVRDLMRHTSGLTYGMPNGTPLDRLYNENKIGDRGTDLAGMVQKLSKLPLQYQPGTRFNYSVSTDVLGRVVEVVSGKPLDDFFQERIFGPLDMHDTGFFVPADKRNRLTGSYRPGEKGSLRVADNPATSRYRIRPKYLSGGGGLVSTARDYARFCQMLLNGGELQGTRLLRPETVGTMTSNQLPAEAPPMTLGGLPLAGLGFGLGVSVRLPTKTASPDPAAGEYGWSGAASTYFWVAPKAELAVVVLQQVEPFSFGLMLALKPVIYGAIGE
jgi:CubicO group peptidase (beta-lactamase class C family)